MADRVRDCPKLERDLTKLGCPYPQGSPESVAWLQGFRRGILRSLVEVCAGFGRPLPKWAQNETGGRLQ